MPDGCRRYARKTRITENESYLRGAGKLYDFCYAALQSSLVSHLTIFLLSKRNLLHNSSSQRTDDNLASILVALDRFFARMRGLAGSREASVDFRVMGDLVESPEELNARSRVVKREWRNLLKTTRELPSETDSSFRCDVLINYSGVEDTLCAIKETPIANPERSPLTKVLMSVRDKLLVHDPVDVVIRTGGHFRLSDAPLFPLINANFLVTSTLFPALTNRQINELISKALALKKGGEDEQTQQDG